MSTSAPPLPLQNHGGAHASTPSRRERDETYWGVIVALSDRWRVILCKDGIQWILQKRSVPSPNTGTWAGKSYSTSRSRLIAACSSRELLSEAFARQVLEALPSNVRDYTSQIGLPRAKLDWPEGDIDTLMCNLSEAAKASSM
jgi:hypothetical protein